MFTVKEIENDLKKIRFSENNEIISGFLSIKEIAKYTGYSISTTHLWVAEAVSKQEIAKLGTRYWYKDVASVIFKKIYEPQMQKEYKKILCKTRQSV